MMKMKVTHERLFGEFEPTAMVWLARGENAKSKLGYAIEKMRPRIKKAKETYSNLLEEINIDECSVDDKQNIIRDDDGPPDDGGYVFTKEGKKKRNKRRQQLWEQGIEIEVYFATTVPDDLTTQERDAFAGLVIEEKVQAAAAGPDEGV